MKQETLANGVRVLLYPLSEIKSVHVHVYAKGGSLMEDPKINGSAHFMEHMLLQGTPTFANAQEISRYIETLAGSFNAYTSDREIAFHVTLPYTHANEAIQLAKDIWFDSTFPEEAFVKEKRAVLSEAAQTLDGLNYKLGKFFKDTRYRDGSKLQQFTIGTPDVIASIQLDQVKTYWETYLTPGNTYVLVVGNIDSENVMQEIRDTFGTQEEKPFAPLFTNISANDFASGGVFINYDKELQSNYVDVVIPSLPLESDRKLLMTQGLAIVMLGQLQTSRLQKTLRWEKGLVYGASADSSVSPHIGDVSFSSEIRDEQYQDALPLLVDLVTDFITNGPTEEEIAHAKQYLENQTYMAFDEPSHIIRWMKREFVWKDKVLLPEDTLAILKSITKEDILTLMHTKWDFPKTQLIQQGPQKDSVKLRKFLEKQLARIQAIS